ncbi:hypothetical protein ACIRPT_20935 [Streptomyces sp. NPDC101227]|uniref:hypothetical protein n=1 Tax=Streptomyces sp. NPDC101227 TaxID=3366136 RepID=UPI003806F258
MTDALVRDSAQLLKEYEGGVWHPTLEEHTLAEDLAHMHWRPESIRAALREVHPAVRAGRLVDVLDPATTVLESRESVGGGAADAAVLALRRLIDVLAADS